MTRKYKFSFFTFLFSLLFFLPHAAHGRLAVHHIHRSLLPHGQHVHRQISLSNVTGNQDSPDPGGTSSSPPSTNTAPDDSPATTAPTATTTPSSSDPLNPVNNLLLPGSSSSPPPQTSDPPSSSDSTPTPTPTPTPTSSNPPSSPSTSSPASATCALGLDPLGQCILPPASTDVSSSSVASSGTPASTDVSSSSVASSQAQTSGTPLLSDILPSLSSNAPTSSSPPSSNTAASSASTSSGTPILPDILPSLSSNAPTSSSPPSSNTPASSAATSSGTPILPDILPPISSSAPTSSAPPSSSSDAPTSPLLSNTPISLPLPLSDNPTSSTPPSSNTPVSSPLPSPSNAPISLLPSSAPISLPPLSSNTPNSLPSASSPPASLTNLPSASASPSPDNQSSPAPSSSAPIDPCGPVGLLLGLCTTSGTPASAPIPSSGSFPTSQPPSPSALSPSQSGFSSIPGSFSQSASDPAAESSSGSPIASSSPPVISFPSYTTGQNDQTTGVPSTFAGPSAPVNTQNSQFSYVTVTSLLGAYIPSSSIPPTLTNPDAATTTLSLPDSSNSAAGPVPSAPLPTDLPARIYPPNMVSTSDLPTNDVLCSILFTSFLNWEFVVANTQSQGQIFLWAPILIATALNISLPDTPPFALQVFVPATYGGPSDAPKLLTEYLFYLQEDLVPVLANQIKVISSPFYTIGQPYRELAKQVDAAFALTSVPNPNTVPGATSSASSGGNKSRTATIIGVVSALGGLALVILGILIFNGVKRTRELRHQRLSDPNLPNDPYPDRTGRDFDQDSVGGPRRRSFYFAEDSLRGQSQTAEQSTVPMAQAQTQFVVQPESQIQYISRTSPENIRERRAPVVPGTISAPILTQSSLNW